MWFGVVSVIFEVIGLGLLIAGISEDFLINELDIYVTNNGNNFKFEAC